MLRQFPAVGLALSLLALLILAAASPAQETHERTLSDHRTAAAAGADAMPEVLYNDHDVTYPAFVSANRVLTAEGQIDGALFSEENLWLLEKAFQNLEADGSTSLGYTRHHRHEPRSLRESIGHYPNVILGETTGVTPGLYHLAPGYLIRIALIEALKGFEPSSEVFLFLQTGSIQVGKARFYPVTDQYAVPIPRPDERVLLLLSDDVDLNNLVPIDADQLVVLPEHGRLGTLPAIYTEVEVDPHPWTVEELLEFTSWIDTNHDGLSDPGESLSVVDAGVTRIETHFRESRRRDQYGNEFRYLSHAWISESGRMRRVHSTDVFLVEE